MARRFAVGRWREPGIRGHQATAGWAFLAPVILILGLFLVVPIALAAWVSFSDWNGNGSPLGANAHYVGLANYRHLLTTPGLDQNNFGTSLRNNLYYVDPRRSHPDRGGALPGGPRQQAREAGRILPHRVLLPVGHELGRNHGALPLPLFADRRDQQASVVLRRDRAGLALRSTRPLPRHPRPVRRAPVDLALEPVLPRRELLGLAVWSEHRDVRLHRDGRVHDLGDVHAALSRGLAEHRRVGQRSGRTRRRDRVAASSVTSRCR